MTYNPDSNPPERRAVPRAVVEDDHLPDDPKDLAISIANMERELENLEKLDAHAREAAEGVGEDVDSDTLTSRSKGAIDLLKASLDQAKAKQAKMLERK